MEKLLEYQKLDTEIFKLEREVSKNEHKKQAQSMVGVVKDAQNKILELDKTSKNLVEELEKLKVVQNKGISLVEKYSKQFSKSMSEAELKELKVRLTQTYSQLNELENRMLYCDKKSKMIMQEFETEKKKTTAAKAKHQESKTKFDEYYQTKLPEINKLKEKMQNLEKSLDASIVARYKTLKQDGIFPVFVPLVDKRCGGCRMELPSGAIEKLKNAKKLECPSCRRLIYVK